jgi:hypothetical protein
MLSTTKLYFASGPIILIQNLTHPTLYEQSYDFFIEIEKDHLTCAAHYHVSKIVWWNHFEMVKGVLLCFKSKGVYTLFGIGVRCVFSNLALVQDGKLDRLWYVWHNMYIYLFLLLLKSKIFLYVFIIIVLKSNRFLCPLLLTTI